MTKQLAEGRVCLTIVPEGYESTLVGEVWLQATGVRAGTGCRGRVLNHEHQAENELEMVWLV